MTNIKVSPQDIKPLHHTPPGHLFWTPSGHTSLYITLWTQPDVGYPLRTLPLNPLWTHLDVGHPPRTLPLNPLWTHLDVGHPPRTLPLNPLWTHLDVGHPPRTLPLNHLWTHLTAIEHPPRTLPLDPLWTTYLVISRGVRLFYGIAQCMYSVHVHVSAVSIVWLVRTFV